MPTVDDYAPLAPFTLDELVSAANSILRDRPSLKIQGRTVRYYIANGLLPPPSGGPKFARYSIDHLRRIVGIRMGQDSGLKLQEAAQAETFASMPPPMPGVGSVVRRIRLTPKCILEVEPGEDPEQDLREALDALSLLLRRPS